MFSLRTLPCIVLSLSFFATGYDEQSIRQEDCDMYVLVFKKDALPTDCDLGDLMPYIPFFQKHPEIPAVRFAATIKTGGQQELGIVKEEDLFLFPFFALLRMEGVKAVILDSHDRDGKVVLSDGSFFVLPEGYASVLVLLCVREDIQRLFDTQQKFANEDEKTSTIDAEFRAMIEIPLDEYFDENSQPLQVTLPWYKVVGIRLGNWILPKWQTLTLWWTKK